MVSKFLNCGGYKVRNKLLKIINTILEKGEVPSNRRKALINNSKRKVIRVSVVIIDALACFFLDSKLLSMMIVFRLRDTLEKFSEKNSVFLGWVDNMFIKFSLKGK